MKEWISDDRSMDVIITKRERGGQRDAANINLNLFSRDGTSRSRRETPSFMHYSSRMVSAGRGSVFHLH